MKNKIITLALLPSMLYVTPALAFDESCDQECQSAISFSKEMDQKDKEIQSLQKQMEIERIKKELKSLSSGGSDDSNAGSEFETEVLGEIEALKAELDIRLNELADSKVKDHAEEIPVIKDTTGIENVFVTGTSSVGSAWKARVYYNNSIESLFVGDDVYPGAIIVSIDRRGMVIKENGVEHVKRITSSEIAHARAFNNIQEENEIKKLNRQGIAQPMNQENFMPPY